MAWSSPFPLNASLGQCLMLMVPPVSYSIYVLTISLGVFRFIGNSPSAVPLFLLLGNCIFLSTDEAY